MHISNTEFKIILIMNLNIGEWYSNNNHSIIIYTWVTIDSKKMKFT
jgi:hypothetical protein